MAFDVTVLPGVFILVPGRMIAVEKMGVLLGGFFRSLLARLSGEGGGGVE